ncbi:hypothetical protein DFH06DRAFT_1441030 [Mycena polygramma]|nr:hypothetical protein DFH06DRAFT_1441030 [Mycena polygramma]
MADPEPPAAAAPVPCVLQWIWASETIPEHIKLLSLVKVLRDMKMSPIDLVIKLLVPQAAYRDNADGFYRSNGLENLLNLVSRDKRGRKKLQKWQDDNGGIDRLLKDIQHEMDDLTVAFKRSTSEITPESLLGFDFEEHITEVCREHTPKLRRILMTAAQTPRAARENTLKDPESVVQFSMFMMLANHATAELVTMIQAQLAKTRSQNSNLCAIPCSLYFLSSGMPRKVVDTLAHAGMNLSYNSTHAAHATLADGQIRRAQLAARDGHSASWDNTNISTSNHVEQRALAPPKVQTGTTMILYKLRGLLDIRWLELLPILDASLITFSADIRPTHSELKSTQQHLCISIVELLVKNSPGFEYVAGASELKHPQYRPPPADHKTTEHVLRTTIIDEGSTDGTVQVNDNLYIDQLKFGIHDLDNIAVPSYNDQKTNALIRSARLLRMGDLSALLRLEHYQPCYQLAPGAFHLELNLSWMLLKIHRGNGADLGSLQYFIGLLAKVRLASSAQPDFETLGLLFNQVLAGAMLHYRSSAKVSCARSSETLSTCIRKDMARKGKSFPWLNRKPERPRSDEIQMVEDERDEILPDPRDEDPHARCSSDDGTNITEVTGKCESSKDGKVQGEERNFDPPLFRSSKRCCKTMCFHILGQRSRRISGGMDPRWMSLHKDVRAEMARGQNRAKVGLPPVPVTGTAVESTGWPRPVELL